ncbi:MAG: nuclease-related domain-containing protein [Hyphomicrobiales bacterium]
MESIAAYLSVVMMLSGFLLILILQYFIREHYRLKQQRLPFTKRLLRLPGQSLLKAIDSINQEATIWAVTLFIAPVYAYAFYTSSMYFKDQATTQAEAVMMGVILLCFVIYNSYKLAGLLRKRRLLRLGYDGEVAVGQELSQLMREGYHVFHDFPAGQFNIGHVVVGSKGVFAVETKTRSKPKLGRGREDATVEYTGRVLHFPKWTDTHIIEQAERQADWLSEWIGGAIGEPVAARAIVALPGWFVKRTSIDGIPVVSPKQFQSLFEHIKPRALSEETIRRIVHQLDQRCRDADPLSSVHASEDTHD